MNADWRFRFYHEVERGTAERVDLPHTWNAQDALAGQLDYWRGIGCYEKRLAVCEEWRGKRLFLRFEGANSVADVFVNGCYVGQHRGGYGAFVFEITGRVRYGAENVVAVFVSNSEPRRAPRRDRAGVRVADGLCFERRAPRAGQRQPGIRFGACVGAPLQWQRRGSGGSCAPPPFGRGAGSVER